MKEIELKIFIAICMEGESIKAKLRFPHCEYTYGIGYGVMRSKICFK